MKLKGAFGSALTVILLLAVLCAAGLAFVPSIITSMGNRDDHECYEYSKMLLSVLEDKMEADEDNMFWYDLVEEGNSSKLLNALSAESGKPEDVSRYYIKFQNNRLKLLCSEHPQVLDMTLKLPDNPVRKIREYTAPTSDFVTMIHAEGTGMYFVGAPLDRRHPKKTVFTDSDRLSSLFSDIDVVASYAGGGERVLKPNEYKIIVGKLDMSAPAHRSLIIEYGGYPKLRTVFDIDILPNDRRDPLIVKSGSLSYELTYWDWMDYFSDTLEVTGQQYMDFSPSIVRYDGQYYYFPDGFTVIKDSKYNSSITGARDKNVHDKRAHFVLLDTESEPYTGNAAKNPKEGSIRINGAKDEVYVWQDKPSKEFGKGWVQIFGEIKKIED